MNALFFFACSIINNEKQNQPAKVISITRKRIVWYAAAAAIIALAFFGTRFLINTPAPQIATTFGEIKQQQLPDGTEVFLNANSNVSYKNNWIEGTAREVWIKGEAFFHYFESLYLNLALSCF